MSILDRLDPDLAAAMRARDQVSLSALRLLKTALTNRSVERGAPLDESEAVKVVRSLAKQRHDSIEQFGKAGRTDLVDKEKAELAILEGYLPPAMDAADLQAIVAEAVATAGATSVKDVGPVMKAALARLEGKDVDRKQLMDLIRARLSQGQP